MTDFLLKLLLISLSGGIISILIFLLKPILKKCVSKAFMYYIWAVVLLRLIVPFGIDVSLPTIPKTVEETQSETYSEYIEDSAENSIFSEISENINFSESTPIMPESSQTEEIPSQSIDESIDESIVQSFPEEDFSAPQNSIPEQSEVQNETQEQSKEPSGIIIGDTNNDPPSPQKPSHDENNENEYINTPPQNIEEPKTEKAFGFLNFLAEHAFSFWLCGFIVCMLWYSTAYLLYTRNLKKSFTAPNPADWKIFNKVCGNNKINLVMSSKVEIPMQIGIFNPKILLPKAEYSKNGREEQLRFILMHELVHFKRRDIIFKWITIFVTSLHWFNPILYFVRRDIAESCELACDEAVIKELNEQERKSYGNALITFSANREKAPFGTAATLFESKQQLKERLVNIMKFKKVTKSALCIMIAVSLLLCGCALTVFDVDDSSDQSEDISSVDNTNESTESDTVSDDNSDNTKSENSDESAESTESSDTSDESNTENDPPIYSWSDHKKWDITKTDEALPYFKAFLLGQRKFTAARKNVTTNADEYLVSYYGTKKYCLIDLDGDNVPELVTLTGDRYIILKYIDGKMYGYYLIGEKYGELKSDGSFMVTETTENRFIRRLTVLNTEGFEYENIAIVDKNRSTSDPDDLMYTIDRKRVSEEEGITAFEKHLNSPNAVWYDNNYEDMRRIVTTEFFFGEIETPNQNMTDKEKALDAFAAVMNNERKFRAHERADRKIRFYLSELSDYISYDTAKLWVKEFTLVDLNNSDIPELVNHIYNENNEEFGYQILLYSVDNNEVHSFLVDPILFQDLKQDGTYYWELPSEGLNGIAENSAFNSNGGVVPIKYNVMSDKYGYYGNVENEAVEQQSKKANVEWHEFNDENVKKYIAESFTKVIVHGDAYNISEIDYAVDSKTVGNQRITTISDRASGTVYTYTITETFENGKIVSEYYQAHNHQFWLIGERDTVYEYGIEMLKTKRNYEGYIVNTTIYKRDNVVYKSRKNVDGEFYYEFKVENGMEITNYFRDGVLTYRRTETLERLPRIKIHDANGTLMFESYRGDYFYHISDEKVFKADTLFKSSDKTYSAELSVKDGENYTLIGKFNYNSDYELINIESLGDGFTEETAKAEFEEFIKFKAKINEIERNAYSW